MDLLHRADDRSFPSRPRFSRPRAAPPQAELSFDRTPAFDPFDPELIPELDFDQSPRDHWHA